MGVRRKTTASQSTTRKETGHLGSQCHSSGWYLFKKCSQTFNSSIGIHFITSFIVMLLNSPLTYLPVMSFSFCLWLDAFPLQLGAELDRSEACRILLNEGAPAGVWDDSGMSCMSLMILKMPPVVCFSHHCSISDNLWAQKMSRH